MSFGKNISKLYKISCNSPQNPANDAKFTPFIDPLYINAFRCLTISRELVEIPANRPNFTHFAHSSGKLREIHTTMISDSSPSAENSLRFQRIDQISRISPTVPVNYAKFVQSMPITSEPD